MKKYRKYLIAALVILVFIGAACRITGNPVVFINNQRLKNNIRALQADEVFINSLIPFEWDTLYTFEPYQSRAEIEEIIGFKSSDIKENNINEGMVHLLFVKDKKVAASILSYPDNLGYSINFEGQISFSENAEFEVKEENGVVNLNRKR